MFFSKQLGSLLLCLLAIGLTGCATTPLAPMDYTRFKEIKPRSIVVLPPLNNTHEVSAAYNVLSHATRPLAEAGYYVLPVALVDEAFRENGLTQAADIHAVSVEKLEKIFGADAALYLTVDQYGTSFKVVDSVTLVTVSAKLVDLRTGNVFWAKSASASSEEGKSQSQGGGLAILITAIVKQIVATTSNQSDKLAQLAMDRLLSAGTDRGILYGPRSPKYAQD